MKIVKGLLFVAVCALMSTPVQGGVLASVLLDTTSLRAQVFNTTTSMWDDVSAADLTIIASDVDLFMRASLNGAPSTNTFATYALGDAQPFDVAQAQQSTGGVVPTGFANSVPSGTTDAWARADGQVTGGLVVPGGLNIKTIAEIESMDGSFGFGVSNVGASARFLINTPTSGTYRLAGTATLTVEYLSDSLLSASGAASLSSTSNQTPNVESSVLFDYEDFGTVAQITTSTSVFSDEVVLVANRNTVLSVTQEASVRLGVVPEPSSAICFAALGLVAIGRRRRRRA